MLTVHPIFNTSVAGLCFVAGLGLFLIWRASKPKEEFFKSTGKIVYLSNKLPNENNQNNGKDRYLQLENNNRIFNIFIGKESGDFKPQYENIDNLSLGDSVDIYYDDNLKTEANQINRLTQFIDKNNIPYFIKGKMDKVAGEIALCISIIGVLILIYLKRMGKIS